MAETLGVEEKTGYLRDIEEQLGRHGMAEPLNGQLELDRWRQSLDWAIAVLEGLAGPVEDYVDLPDFEID